MEQLLLPIILTALLSVSGSYFVFSRRALTRVEHEKVCKTQSSVTRTELAAMKEHLDRIERDVRMLVTHLLPERGGR